MTVYNYRLLVSSIFDRREDICSDITKLEEQGWEFVSGNSAMEVVEGNSVGLTFVALMRKPK